MFGQLGNQETCRKPRSAALRACGDVLLLGSGEINSDLFQGDGIHPNALGTERTAQCWRPVIEELMEQPAGGDARAHRRVMIQGLA